MATPILSQNPTGKRAPAHTVSSDTQLNRTTLAKLNQTTQTRANKLAKEKGEKPKTVQPARFVDVVVEKYPGLTVRVARLGKTYRTRITCPESGKRRVITLGTHGKDFTMATAFTKMLEYREQGVAAKESADMREAQAAICAEEAARTGRGATVIDGMPGYYESELPSLKRPDVVKDIFHRFIWPMMVIRGEDNSLTVREILTAEKITEIENLIQEVNDLDPLMEVEDRKVAQARILGDIPLMFKPLDEIETVYVVEQIERIQRAHGDEPARKALAYLGRFYRRCKARKLATVDPTDCLGTKIFKFKKPERIRRLHREEVPVFYEALDKATMAEGTKLGLRLLLLTGIRSGELQAAEWKHVKFDKATLYIPAGNTKTNKAITVPLPPQAITLLERLRMLNGSSGMVLGGIAKDTLTQALTRLQPKTGPKKLDLEGGKLNVHDLRRSFSTFTAELGVEPHVVEKMLNHSLQGVAAVYNKAELLAERKAAICKLADALDNPMELLPESSQP